MNLHEQRAHFALWALLKSPLLVSADLRSIDPPSLDILLAEELIAVNQDPLGVAGDLIWKQGPQEVGIQSDLFTTTLFVPSQNICPGVSIGKHSSVLAHGQISPSFVSL